MKKSALLFIIIAGVFWGTSGLFSSWLTPYGFTPVQMTTMRGTVSAVLMVIYILIKDPKLFRLPKKEILLVLGSGSSLFFTAFTYFMSIKASTVSTAVILMYTAPIFVLIYSVLFLGEKLNLIKGISIFLMIVGCALVSGIVGGMKFSPLGVIFGLTAGIGYSAYNIFAKVLSMHKVPTETITGYSFLVMGTIGLFVCNPVGLVTIAAAKPLETIPFIIGIGVFTCILPYFLYNIGLREVPAGTATALGIIEPLSATLLSVAFLGEQMTIPLGIGIVLILGAVFVLAEQK